MVGFIKTNQKLRFSIIFGGHFFPNSFTKEWLRKHNKKNNKKNSIVTENFIFAITSFNQNSNHLTDQILILEYFWKLEYFSKSEKTSICEWEKK